MTARSERQHILARLSTCVNRVNDQVFYFAHERSRDSSSAFSCLLNGPLPALAPTMTISFEIGDAAGHVPSHLASGMI